MRRSWLRPIYWLVGLVGLAWFGTRIDHYRLHVMHMPLPHPYPWRGVTDTAVIMTLEAMVFYLILRPRSYRLSRSRALGAFLLGLLLVVVFGVLYMHAPPYAAWHWLWLVGATIGFLVLLAGC